MESKKSKEANLESKRAGFFFVGFVMISAVVGMAFEYNQFIPAPEIVEKKWLTTPDDMIFDIQEEEIPEEEPDVAPPPPVIEEIEVVEDEEEVPELDLSSMEEEVEDIPDEVEEVIKEEPILEFAEVDPAFPGGQAAMAQWIQDNVEYPELAREMGEQGTVYVKFVVNKNGSIEQVVIRKGISDALDAEAKRVVKRMPKWTPGEQAGKPVRVSFTLPISFKLG